MNMIASIVSFCCLLFIASSTFNTDYENCIGSCSVCSQTKQSCLVCSKSSVLINSGKCVPCSSLCLACTGINQCVQCLEGSALLTLPEGSFCLQCSIGCLTCQSITSAQGSQLRITTCTECMTNFYPSISQTTNLLTCQPCPQGCFTCSNGTTCNECITGFSLNASSLCYDCSDNCLECNSDVGCVKCQLYYFLSIGSQGQENTCVNCMNFCAKCTDQTSCQICNLGFYKPSQNQTCVQCEWPCVICNATLCFECDSNYYLNSSITKFYNNATQKYEFFVESAQCVPCEPNCQRCSGPQCKSCSGGYYVTPSGTCQNCMVNCLYCVNAVSCLECNSGYYVLNNLCQPCVSNCAVCSKDLQAPTSQVICHYCQHGYFVQANTTCVSCSSVLQGCLYCFYAQQCAQCQQGFTLNSQGICQNNDDLSASQPNPYPIPSPKSDIGVEANVSSSNIGFLCLGTGIVGMGGIILWNWCKKSEMRVLREQVDFDDY